MRRTGSSQLKLKESRGGATHAFHHTRQQQPNSMKGRDKEVVELGCVHCESEQGHYVTEAMEKRVLDMQAKVMTQTCHVFIPRPIVDNIIQPG